MSSPVLTPNQPAAWPVASQGKGERAGPCLGCVSDLMWDLPLLLAPQGQQSLKPSLGLCGPGQLFTSGASSVAALLLVLSPPTTAFTLSLRPSFPPGLCLGAGSVGDSVPL